MGYPEWRTKRVPRKQYALEFTVPPPLENKGSRAYSLFAFFGFTAELIFDRKLN
jgi:hypothetical protein